jgi:hypothetical protein
MLNVSNIHTSAVRRTAQENGMNFLRFDLTVQRQFALAYDIDKGSKSVGHFAVYKRQ